MDPNIALVSSHADVFQVLPRNVSTEEMEVREEPANLCSRESRRVSLMPLNSKSVSRKHINARRRPLS